MKYDAKKLAEVKVVLPTDQQIRRFSIGNIKMDDVFVWTIMLKFQEMFKTVNAQYNMIFCPHPEFIQDNINSIVKKYLDPQMQLNELHELNEAYKVEDDEDPEELEDGISFDPVDRINEQIEKWNEAVKRMKVYNIEGVLDKYERKKESKDISLVIGKHDVDYFKNVFNPTDGWGVIFEKYSMMIDGKETPITVDLDAFLMSPLSKGDFLSKEYVESKSTPPTPQLPSEE